MLIRKASNVEVAAVRTIAWGGIRVHCCSANRALLARLAVGGRTDDKAVRDAVLAAGDLIELDKIRRTGRRRRLPSSWSTDTPAAALRALGIVVPVTWLATR